MNRSFRIAPLALAACAVLRLAVPAAGQDAGAVVEGETGRAVDAYLRRLEALGFAGTALVVEDGRPVLRKGYGLADREAGIPMTSRSVFSLGSITKQFTAAAILALEARGRLSVRDSLGAWFDDVPPDKRGITLHMLLTHTSGLRSDFAPTDFDPAGRDRDAYVRRALDSELLFPPGAGYAYANAGYSLLAAIVEKATGEPYEEALRELVLDPAGMTETGYRIPGWDPERLAVGYRDGERWGTIVERWTDPAAPYWQLRGNGGLHTTLADVQRWDAALRTDAVLPAAERERMFTPYVAEGPDSVSFYGYGWAIEQTPRHGKLVQHNGGNGIFVAELHRWVDAGLTVFVFTSDPAMSATPIARQVEHIAFGEPHDEPPVVAKVDPAALEALAGAWRLPSGERLTVSIREGCLAVAPTGPEGLALLYPLPPRGRDLATGLEERTRRIVAAVLGGEYGPLAEAFGGQVPIERIRRNEAGLMEDREKRLGRSTGFEIAGVVPVGPGLGVVARFDFERGAAWNTYVWGPDGLRGVRPAPDLPPVDYVPVSSTAFESFRLRGPAGPPIEVVGTGADAVLVVRAPAGPVEARRSPVPDPAPSSTTRRPTSHQAGVRPRPFTSISPRYSNS